MTAVMHKMFAHLDAFGTSDPGFREGHPEDRCPLCSRPVDEHRGFPAQRYSTVWAHRLHALRYFI